MCYAIINVVVFVQPQWLGDTETSKGTGYFGLWKSCRLLQDGQDLLCEGRLDDFTSISTPAFRAATVFVATSVFVIFLCLCSFLLFFFVHSSTVFHICGWLQATNCEYEFFLHPLTRIHVLFSRCCEEEREIWFHFSQMTWTITTGPAATLQDMYFLSSSLARSLSLSLSLYRRLNYESLYVFSMHLHYEWVGAMWNDSIHFHFRTLPMTAKTGSEFLLLVGVYLPHNRCTDCQSVCLSLDVLTSGWQMDARFLASSLSSVYPPVSHSLNHSPSSPSWSKHSNRRSK